MGTCSQSIFSLFSLFSEGAYHLFLKLHDNHFSKLWSYGKHFHQVHDIFDLGRSLFEVFFCCHGNYAIWTIDVLPLITNSSEDVVIFLRRCCAPWQKYQKWKVVIPARSQRKMSLQVHPLKRLVEMISNCERLQRGWQVHPLTSIASVNITLASLRALIDIHIFLRL